jgi:hypothetical protein
MRASDHSAGIPPSTTENTMRITRAGNGRAALAALVALAATGACGKHYLRDYQFADKTIGLAYVEPPAPELLHGWYNLDAGQTAVQTVVRAGATVAKEIEARRASARLDSAVRQVDVAGKLAQRTLERASRYLGTRAVATPEGADFVLEIHMRSFGIDARSSRATYLFTRAEAVLIDRRTGREIWSETVRGSDRLTPWVLGTDNVPSAIFTAATLHTVSVQDFAEALDQLVTYTSNLITDELREKLRDARDR